MGKKKSKHIFGQNIEANKKKTAIKHAKKHPNDLQLAGTTVDYKIVKTPSKKIIFR